MIAMLLNHLWQSSLVAGGACLMALALSRNGANVRFWLWFAASIKFLIPFAALTALSATVLMPVLPTLSAPSVARIEPLAKPFSVTTTVPVTIRLAAEPSLPPAPPVRAAEPTRPAPPAAQPVRSAPSAFHFDLGSALLALWLAGFLMLVFRWIVRWSRVRALLRDAVAMPVDAPVAVKFSASRLEPGLVGILNPVILLPRGIEQQLSRVELKAVLAHELCHWRRRDNLLAAIHMLVETLFWFFPLVWWLGARLNSERERACDESVLADGNDPQIYAEGILKVCRAYLQSPLACVAGVSGAGLKKRIDAIMENRLILRLNAARKFVLSASAAAALALPLALGLLAVPVVQLQAKAAQILSPVKTAQRENEQTSPPETALAALPASPVPENPAVPQTQDAATTSADAALPAAAPQSIPDAVMARNDPAQALNTVQEMTAQNSVAQAPAAGACEAPKVAASVPLESVPGSGLMTVPVGINGSPRKFLIDLNFLQETKVSPELVTKLGLPNVLPNKLQLNGVPIKSDAVAVHSLNIGGIITERMSLGVAEKITRSAAYDGLLSGSFLRQYDVELDFAAKKITLLTPPNCTDPDRAILSAYKDVAIIPVRLAPDGRLQVPVTIEGRVVNAEIDTSSARTVMRRDAAEQGAGLKLSNLTPVSGVEDGRHMQVYTHTFPQLTIAGGAIAAQNVQVLVQNYSMTARGDFERIPDLAIGMDILGKLHMVVAYQRGRLYVISSQPQSNPAPAPAAARNDPPPAPQAAAPTSVAQALAARNDVAVIPVTSAPDGRLRMQVTIEGHVVYAELDTNAARTVMRRDIAERSIGLKPDTPDMTPVSGLEDGRHMQVYVHTFPQLTFAGGGVTAVNVPVLIQDYSMLPANDRHTALGTRGDFERIPDLVIGMDVLGQLHMEVALAEGRAYVTSARPAPDAAPATAMASAQQPRVPNAAQPVAAEPTTDQLRFQQTVEARTACTDQNTGPGSPDYLGCVNGYLQAHYGWRIVARRDGSLRAASAAYPGGNSAGSIGGHDFNPSPPTYVPNTGSSQPR